MRQSALTLCREWYSTFMTLNGIHKTSFLPLKWKSLPASRYRHSYIQLTFIHPCEICAVFCINESKLFFLLFIDWGFQDLRSLYSLSLKLFYGIAHRLLILHFTGQVVTFLYIYWQSNNYVTIPNNAFQLGYGGVGEVTFLKSLPV